MILDPGLVNIFVNLSVPKISITHPKLPLSEVKFKSLMNNDPLFDRFPLHLDTLLIIQYPGMKINLLSKIFQVLLQNMKLKLKQSCLVTIRRFLYKFEIAIFSSFRCIFLPQSESATLVGHFTTRPLSPSNLSIGNVTKNEIVWDPSMSPLVRWELITNSYHLINNWQ